MLGQKTDHITTVFKDATFKETTSEDRLNATVNKYSVNIFGSQVRCSLLEKEESPGVIVVIFNFDEPSWNTDRFAEMLYFLHCNFTTEYGECDNWKAEKKNSPYSSDYEIIHKAVSNDHYAEEWILDDHYSSIDYTKSDKNIMISISNKEGRDFILSMQR